MLKVGVLLVLGFPVLCAAETPFAGTWTVDPAVTQYSLRPLSFTVDHGIYKRSSCVPNPEVPADGKEHAVAGDPLLETMSVRLMDKRRVQVVGKVAGKVVWQGIYAVSKDLKTMTLEFQDHRPTNGVTGTIEFLREGDPVAGANPMTGTWSATKLLNLSPTGLTMTIADTDNGLTMQSSDGRSFDIKFDRQDYPLMGYASGATVQVGRREERILQFNRKQHGRLVEMSIGKVSDDGQTMELGQLDEQCQSKVTWTLHKRPAS